MFRVLRLCELIFFNAGRARLRRDWQVVGARYRRHPVISSEGEGVRECVWLDAGVRRQGEYRCKRSTYSMSVGSTRYLYDRHRCRRPRSQTSAPRSTLGRLVTVRTDAPYHFHARDWTESGVWMTFCPYRPNGHHVPWHSSMKPVARHARSRFLWQYFAHRPSGADSSAGLTWPADCTGRVSKHNT